MFKPHPGVVGEHLRRRICRMYGAYTQEGFEHGQVRSNYMPPPLATNSETWLPDKGIPQPHVHLLQEDVSHPNLGYDYREGTGEVKKTWPESDEMIESRSVNI